MYVLLEKLHPSGGSQRNGVVRFDELSSDGSVLRKYVDRVRTWDGNNLLTSSCFSCFCVYQKSPSPVDVGNGSS